MGTSHDEPETTGKARILMLEDDASLSATVSDFFSLTGHQVDTTQDNRSFLYQLRQGGSYDLILVDLNLPDRDGLDIIEDFRKRESTLLYVVSGRKDQETRLRAFELGADDYIVKPFSVRELELKVRNAVQRLRQQGAGGNYQGETSVSLDWTLDADSRSVMHTEKGGLELTKGEFEILTTLVRADGKLVTRDQLLSRLTRTAQITSAESVTTLVYRLRRKFKDWEVRSHIVTVPGEGYRIDRRARPS